jgi:uncharacterized membrane protein HdeD (DUF308 family)
MNADLARNWWVLLIRGILAILFGIIAWMNPLMTLAVLVIVFAAYAIVDGIFAIAMSLTAPREYGGWVWLLASGVAGIAIGVLTFLWPGVTAVLLLYWILAWLVVTGVFQIVAGIRLRKEIRGEFLLILGGIVSVVFGLYLMANPALGALAVLWMIAFYAFLTGILTIVVAIRLKGVRGGADPAATARTV